MSAPFRKTLSWPVRSGSKPAASSIIGETRPSTWTVPMVGLSTPAANLRSVLFPEPLWPMSPTASPGFTSTLTSRSAHSSSGSLRWRKRPRIASLSVLTFSRCIRKQIEACWKEREPGIVSEVMDVAVLHALEDGQPQPERDGGAGRGREQRARVGDPPVVDGVLEAADDGRRRVELERAADDRIRQLLEVARRVDDWRQVEPDLEE